MRPWRRALAAALALPWLAAGAATYKWIDPEGRVNYGDRPPDNVRAEAVRPPPPAASGDGADPALPLPLRSAAARSPVVLYGVRDCGACESLRAHLLRRGVPFTERQVQSDRDAEAFRQLGFSTQAIPTLTIGRDRLSGYDALRLDTMLDAAGYPRASLLPAGWRPPAARPLAAPTEAQEPAARALPEAPARPAPAPEMPAQPGSIRF